MTAIRIYRAYPFKVQDPVIEELRALVLESKLDRVQVAAISGVSHNTLQRWFSKKILVRRPQHATVMAVARALGYDYKLVKSNTHTKLRTL